MKKLPVIFSAICIIFLQSCNQSSNKSDTLRNDPQVAADLAKLWDDYIKVSNKGDFDQLITFFTDDYVNMPFFGSAQTGREETIAFLKDFAENENPTIMKYERVELFIHNMMAYEFGMIEMSRIPSCGDQIISRQRCLTVFKKEPEGKWKFHRWMGQPES